MAGFGRLYTSLLLSRMSGAMLGVSLILFVLGRYHSPQLAGVTAFLSVFPGLVVSPVAGALLDRHGRVRLIVVDYLIAAVAISSIAVLAARHALPPNVLLLIVGVASLTNPLSATGIRSLFPLVAPRYLWERANALDSSGYLISSLLGAPLAGAIIGLAGPEWALAACAVLFVAAAVVMLGLRDPSVAGEGGHILIEAWRGLVYVARNPTLRGLALALGTYNVSWGVLEIAIPVLVLGRLHQGPTTVGVLWGAMGAAGLVSALLTGRINMQGRERQWILGSMVVGAMAMIAMPLARNVLVVGAAIFAVGLSNGPFDIGLFTLRQRRTDPAWFGRAFAVSMALNYAGSPIGAALAGPLIGWSLDLALWVPVAIAGLAALFPMLVIPAATAGEAAAARAAGS